MQAMGMEGEKTCLIITMPKEALSKALRDMGSLTKG